MDEPAVGRARGLHHGLGQGGVTVHDPGDLRVAALQLPDVHQLLDELGRLGPADVPAQQLPVALLADDLDDAAAVAVHRPGAHRPVLDLAHGDVVPGVASLRLGEAEAGDVGGAEGGAGDVDVHHRVRGHPRGVLHRHDALLGGLVGQRGAGHQVADGVHTGAAGALGAVDLDQSLLVELDARRVQAQALDVGPAAGGDRQVVGLQGL